MLLLKLTSTTSRSFCLLLFCIVISANIGPAVGRGVPPVFRHESPVEYKGLYADAAYVVSMNGESLPSHIYGKPYATYLEFYNSYCGFCKRFAPHWKELSENVKEWHEVVQIGAVDCSREENSAVCRQFEVLYYPSIRYIPPRYEAPQNGTKVNSSNHEEMKYLLVQFLSNETNPQPHWPTLTPFMGKSQRDLFAGLPSDVQMGFLIVTDPTATPNTTAQEVILDLNGIAGSVVRWTSSDLLFLPPNDAPKPWVYAVSRSTNVIDNVFKTVPEKISREKIVARLKAYMRLNGIVVPDAPDVPATDSPQPDKAEDESIKDQLEKEQMVKIKDMVKAMKGTVFRADLEMALRYALFIEIPHYNVIDGERLTALKQFLAVVVRHFSFGANAQRFINAVRDYVMTNGVESLKGSDFEATIKRLEEENHPVFSTNRWVGCHSVKDGLRRFPCSLWVLFHHLTVRAEEAESSLDPLEVLQAMHGYIKHFFGCTDCSQHFQNMSVKNRMMSVMSKDDAILWLWAAHNEVNQRLHGDATEDPEFPKHQFPSKDECPQCYRDSSTTGGINGGPIDWNKTEVLFYLKRIHAAQNISILGVEKETALPGIAEALVRMPAGGGGLFYDGDFRMGLMLYVACVVLIVIAVKMFAKRKGWGYRKKLYVHDILGKV